VTNIYVFGVPGHSKFGTDVGFGNYGVRGSAGCRRLEVDTTVGVHNLLILNPRTFLYRTAIQRFAHAFGGVELIAGPVAGFAGTRGGGEKRQRNEKRNGSQAQGARTSSEILQFDRP